MNPRLRCRDCGDEFNVFVWVDATTCPVCDGDLYVIATCADCALDFPETAMILREYAPEADGYSAVEVICAACSVRGIVA